MMVIVTVELISNASPRVSVKGVSPRYLPLFKVKLKRGTAVGL